MVYHDLSWFIMVYHGLSSCFRFQWPFGGNVPIELVPCHIAKRVVPLVVHLRAAPKAPDALRGTDCFSLGETRVLILHIEAFEGLELLLVSLNTEHFAQAPIQCHVENN